MTDLKLHALLGHRHLAARDHPEMVHDTQHGAFAERMVQEHDGCSPDAEAQRRPTLGPAAPRPGWSCCAVLPNDRCRKVGLVPAATAHAATVARALIVWRDIMTRVYLSPLVCVCVCVCVCLPVLSSTSPGKKSQ